MNLIPVIQLSGARKSEAIHLDKAVTHPAGNSCCYSCGAPIDPKRQARHAAFWLYQNVACRWWEEFAKEIRRLDEAPHGKDTCNW